MHCRVWQKWYSWSPFGIASTGAKTLGLWFVHSGRQPSSTIPIRPQLRKWNQTSRYFANIRWVWQSWMMGIIICDKGLIVCQRWSGSHHTRPSLSASFMSTWFASGIDSGVASVIPERHARRPTQSFIHNKQSGAVAKLCTFHLMKRHLPEQNIQSNRFSVASWNLITQQVHWDFGYWNHQALILDIYWVVQWDSCHWASISVCPSTRH